jgi:hypothetical protein
MFSMNRLFLFLLLSASYAFTQDEPAAETTVSTSCSLFVKTTVRPVPMEDRFGQVRVDATLCDKDGVPISDQEIRLSSSTGTFACLPPDTVLAEGDSLNGPCYSTRGNGTITMFLINVPFNRPGRVVAACSYRNFNLKSTSAYIITRKTIKKK